MNIYVLCLFQYDYYEFCEPLGASMSKEKMFDLYGKHVAGDRGYTTPLYSPEERADHIERWDKGGSCPRDHYCILQFKEGA